MAERPSARCTLSGASVTSATDRECCEFPFVYKNAQCMYKCGIGRLVVWSLINQDASTTQLGDQGALVSNCSRSISALVNH